MKKSLVLLLALFGLLPSSAQESISLDGFWDYAIGDSTQYNQYATLPSSVLPDDKAVTRPDSGAIWYRRSVYVPDSWRRHRVSLYLERPNAKTTLYVNGVKQGDCNYVFAPHKYDIVNEQLIPGERNTIAICVENPPQKWEGISGRMELRAQSRNIYIRQVRLRPFPYEGVVQLDLTLDGSFRAFYNEAVAVYIQREGAANARILTNYYDLDNSHMLINVYVGDKVALWDEFHPNLYRIGIAVANDYYETTFGMREIMLKDQQLTVNRYPLFFRGVAVDEETLARMTSKNDEQSWLELFRQYKDRGLNVVRFPSYCPPDAAFIAADKLGLYLQPEGPSWPDYGVALQDGKPADDYLFNESKRLIDNYGHHPSFLMMGSGCNSIGGWGDFCNEWKKQMMHYEPTIVYDGSEYQIRPQVSVNESDTSNVAPVIANVQCKGIALPDLKAQLERNLCDKNNSGFLLDGFNNSIDAETMHQFCSPLVSIAHFQKTEYSSADTLVVPVECYNAFFGDIQSIRASYYISDDSLQVYAGGLLFNGEIPLGKNTSLGTIRMPLDTIKTAQKLTLTIVFSGNKYVNHWDFKVYPTGSGKEKERPESLSSSVIRLGLEPKTPTLKVLCSTD